MQAIPMNNSSDIVRRARILAAQRSGATTYRRDQKVLDLLADAFPRPVGRNTVMEQMGTSSRSTETGKESWVSIVLGEARECLQETSVRLVNSRLRTSKLVLIESDEQSGYTFDALQFPFYLDWQAPPPNDLRQVCFHWITREDCVTCDVQRNGWCSSRIRHFVPANLPAKLDMQLKESERTLPFNHAVLRILKMESPLVPERSHPAVHITACMQQFSSFRSTCLALQEPDNWKLLELPQVGPQDSMGARQLFDAGFNTPKHPARRLGPNLGISLWVTQVNDTGMPVAALLSWRRGQEAKLHRNTSLEVGFGEYHTAASSQIKLGPRLNNLRDQRRSTKIWELPDLEEAVLQELELETALTRKDLAGRPILLGSGWLQQYWYPEVLVMVETKVDLGCLPWKPEDMIHANIEHYDEFRRKIIVPFRSDNLRELAWLLVGLPPEGIRIGPDSSGKEATWVRWSPQGAVAAIMASQWYFKDTTLLQKAVADVIETEVKSRIPFPWPPPKKKASRMRNARD
jgi:hypothetical protein